MDLPTLLIDQNLRASLGVLRQVRETTEGNIIINGDQVAAIEPVAACILSVAARIATQRGQTFCIRNLTGHLCAAMRKMDSPIRFDPDRSVDCDDPEILTAAMAVPASSRANEAANKLADYIARFIPQEDKGNMLRDGYGVRIHNAIQPALAHVLSELVDNVFSHAVTAAYPDPSAWLAVQSYQMGDLMRVAVVDDGCGLLGSMRGLGNDAPKNHFEAAEQAFTPFVTSKGSPTLYAERRHMGLGLAVCREICRRLGGSIYAASGNAWVGDPGLSSQRSQLAEPLFQGTIIALEFHRRAITSGMLRDVLAGFAPSPNSRLRFK